MSAFKGTPGPWKECGHERGGCICGLVFAESSDLVIADASPHCDEETRGHRPDEAARKANARLIAAAPELLEALRDMMPEFESRVGDFESVEWHDCWNKAVAAIAKALGEQP